MSSATEQAYNFIKNAIVVGELKGGSHVPEDKIGAQIGISRTPIRSALQKLSAQGFVTLHPRQGARVNVWTEQDWKEIADMRALLEGYAAGIASQKISQMEIKRLEELADAMEEAVACATEAELAQITELNYLFHMTIIHATANSRLVEAVENLAHPILHRIRFLPSRKDVSARSMAHHREIIDAIVSGNAEWATSIMRSHILASFDPKNRIETPR